MVRFYSTVRNFLPPWQVREPSWLRKKGAEGGLEWGDAAGHYRGLSENVALSLCDTV